MDEQDKSTVLQAILDQTSEWLEAMCRLDADAVMELFDDSDDMQYTEHGVIFSYGELSDFARRSYEATAALDVRWEERQVFCLAPDAASMAGIIGYTATPRSGEVSTGRVAFTGVFVKRGDEWKLIHGQESALSTHEMEQHT
jgi:uncharacterized protein (TIGR02246 family)